METIREFATQLLELDAQETQLKALRTRCESETCEVERQLTEVASKRGMVILEMLKSTSPETINSGNS